MKVNRRHRKAKRRQYELRRMRRLSKAKPRKKKFEQHHVSTGKSIEQIGRNDYQLKAPIDFRLLKNTEECVNFFKKVRSRQWAFVNRYGIKELHIDLSGVRHIDFAATMMLDAICDELSTTEPVCNVFGNTPLRNECQKYLKESGFLNNKVDANGRLFPQESHSDNMKIERGSVKLKDEHVQKVVEIEKHICKHVTGREGRMYRHIDMIKEVCGNTVDWSGAVKDQWSYGVKFEENKAIVVALDLGKGILESITRRFMDIVGDALTRKSHVDILEGAYNKKYGSTSKRRNRNRGLPLLKYCNEKGVIRDLTVVTNNVVLDFTNPDNCRTFYWNRKKALQGTLYSWIIDGSCYK